MVRENTPELEPWALFSPVYAPYDTTILNFKNNKIRFGFYISLLVTSSRLIRNIGLVPQRNTVMTSCLERMCVNTLPLPLSWEHTHSKKISQEPRGDTLLLPKTTNVTANAGNKAQWWWKQDFHTLQIWSKVAHTARDINDCSVPSLLLVRKHPSLKERFKPVRKIAYGLGREWNSAI